MGTFQVCDESIKSKLTIVLGITSFTVCLIGDNVIIYRYSKSDSSEKRTQSKIHHSSVFLEKWHRYSFDQNNQTFVRHQITENLDGCIKSIAGIQTKHNHRQQTDEIGA